MKWDSTLKRIAGDLVAFVDDLRASGFDKESAWAITRQFFSRLQYLGIQDAPRRIRPSTRKEASAWSDSVFKTFGDKVKISFTQKKMEQIQSLDRRYIYST